MSLAVWSYPYWMNYQETTPDHWMFLIYHYFQQKMYMNLLPNYFLLRSNGRERFLPFYRSVNLSWFDRDTTKFTIETQSLKNKISINLWYLLTAIIQGPVYSSRRKLERIICINICSVGFTSWWRYVLPTALKVEPSKELDSQILLLNFFTIYFFIFCCFYLYVYLR